MSELQTRVESNKSAAWQSLASAIGIEIANSCLPVTTWCPQCRNRNLLVTECTTLLVSAECDACGFAGDALDLAAGWWACTREEAERRLDPTLAKLVSGKHQVGTVEEIWHQAKTNIKQPMPKDVVAVVEKLSYGRPGRDDYAERYGWVSAASIYQLLHRPLRVPKAKHYVVVPSWITPSRLAGLHLVSIRENLIVRDYLPCNKDNPESGLTALNEAIQTGDGIIYATFEPLVAPRASKIQHRYNEHLVPVVGCHWDDLSRTNLAWQSLTGKKIVLWGGTLTWQIVSTAAMIDGYIVIKGPEDESYESLAKYVVRREPSEWLHWMSGRIRSWRDMLNRWVPRRASREDLMAMIGHMISNNFDPNIITGQLKGPARNKWQECVTGYANLSRTRAVWITNPKIRILKTRSGWYAQVGTDITPVFNADLQVDFVYPKEGVAWYRGKLVCADVTIPFEAPATQIEGETWAWLRNAAAMFQLHIEFPSRYRSRLFEIATLFKRPDPVKLEDLPPFDPTPVRRSKHDAWAGKDLVPSIAPAFDPATISPSVEDNDLGFQAVDSDDPDDLDNI